MWRKIMWENVRYVQKCEPGYWNMCKIAKCVQNQFSISHNWSWNAPRHLKDWTIIRFKSNLEVKEKVGAAKHKKHKKGYFSPHLIMLRPISTQLDAWSTLVKVMIKMMAMVMVTSTLALDIRTRSNSNRQGWRSSHTGRSGTFGQTWTLWLQQWWCRWQQW